MVDETTKKTCEFRQVELLARALQKNNCDTKINLKPRRNVFKKSKVKTTKNIKPLITGIVVAAGWDDDGNVALISIQGYDEKEYVVKMNRCGKELMGLINRKVKVSGKVSKRIDGKRLIQVSQYDIF